MTEDLKQKNQLTFGEIVADLILREKNQVLGTRTDIGGILDEGNNAGHAAVKRKLDLFRPLYNELRVLPADWVPVILGVADEGLVQVLCNESWRSEVKVYALKRVYEFARYQIKIKDSDIEAFRCRLSFINNSVPSSVLSIDANDPIHRFLYERLSFLTALHKSLPPDDWQALLQDPTIRASWKKIHDAAHLSIKTLTEKDYEDLSHRSTVPIYAGEGAEPGVKPLRDVLDQTGFAKVVAPITKGIKVTKPNDATLGESGHSPHGTRVLPGEIHISVAREEYADLFPTLAHEAGHNLNWRLQHATRGQELFDRYAVSVALNPSKFSSYAYSHCLTNKKALANYTTFIQESFADEFMIYWLACEKIPGDRLAIFDEIHDAVFKNIDRDRLRKNISSVIGNYFGVSVASMILPTEARSARNYALSRSRRDSEAMREYRDGIIDTMTEREMVLWLSMSSHKDDCEFSPEPIFRILYNSIKRGDFDENVLDKLIKEALHTRKETAAPLEKLD